MTDKEFARAHRVPQPDRPPMWVLAAVGAAPFVVIGAVWKLADADVNWPAVAGGVAAFVVGVVLATLYGVHSQELLEDVYEAEVTRLRKANAQLHRQVDDAAGPCPVCAEREAS